MWISSMVAGGGGSKVATLVANSRGYRFAQTAGRAINMFYPRNLRHLVSSALHATTRARLGAHSPQVAWYSGAGCGLAHMALHHCTTRATQVAMRAV